MFHNPFFSSSATTLSRRAQGVFFTFAICCAPALAVTLTSQDFGKVQIATPSTLSISVAAVTPAPAALSLRYATDFSMGACTANASGCALSVTFNPTKPGLRQDAVIVKNASGAIVEEIFLHGVGLGPLPVFSPALATLKAQMPSGEYSLGATAAEPDGKILVIGNDLGTIFEFDPFNSTFVAVPGFPATGTSNSVYAPATDAAGNIYYTNAASGLHRFDAVTGTDSVFAASISPSNLIIDPSGNLFYAVNNQIFKLNPNTQAATVVAGNASKGYKGDGGPATSAEFNNPTGLALDISGNLYVADTGNQRVRKVDTSGNVTTVAGNGTSGLTGDGGLATAAELTSPAFLVTDAAGDLYIAMSAGQVRCVAAGTGIISTVVGATPEIAVNSVASDPFLGVGFSASAQDVSVSGGMTLDGSGNLWVSANALYQVSTAALPLQFPFAAAGQSQTQTLSLMNAGTATLNQPVFAKAGQNAADFTIANTCTGALAIGATCTASVTFLAGAHATSVATITVTDNAPSSPQTIAVSGASGGLLPASQQITAVVVGSSSATPQTVAVQFAGSATGLTAQLAYGTEFKLGTLSCSGTTTVSCTVPVSFSPLYPGQRSDAIQFLDAKGAVIYQCLLNGVGQGPQWFIDPGGLLGTFQIASDLKLSAIDPAGNLYAVPAVGLPTSASVYRLNPQTSQWTLVAGQTLGGVDTGDGGPATSATLTYVNAVAFDSAGNMFIAESAKTRRVDARTGIITTIAQQGGESIAVNSQGFVFVVNSGLGEVFKIDPSTGIAAIYAGNGTLASTGDGGLATAASLNQPSAITFDNAGNLFIAESLNVRRVDATSGIITTYASFCGANSLDFDAAGDLYLSCGDLAIIPAGPGTPYFPQNPTLTNVFSPILRTPAGMFYTSDGVTLSPALPSTLNVNSLPNGSTTATIALTNAGNKALGLNSITLSGANASAFSQTNNCGQSLAAAQTCAVNLTFPAAQQQQLIANLTVSSALPALQTSLDVPGTLPILQLSATSVSFGSVQTGVTAQSSVTLTNQSSLSLTISSIVISGPNASNFTVSSNCGTALASGQTCSPVVSFYSTANGMKSATLTITDNASGSPQVIALSAIAFPPKQEAVWSSWYGSKAGQQSKVSESSDLRPNSLLTFFTVAPTIPTPSADDAPRVIATPEPSLAVEKKADAPSVPASSALAAAATPVAAAHPLATPITTTQRRSARPRRALKTKRAHAKRPRH